MATTFQATQELGNFTYVGLTGTGYERILEISPQVSCGWQSVITTSLVQGTIDASRPVPILTPKSGSGLVTMRVGIDCPCGSSFEAYRLLLSFPIASLPSSVVSCVLQVSHDATPVGIGATTAYRSAQLDVLNLGTDLIWISEDDTTVPVAQQTAGVLQTVLNVLQPNQPTGVVTTDITTGYNAAKAAGFAFLNLRFRLTDESSGPCNTGTAWYGLLKSLEPRASVYNPRLGIQITSPGPGQGPKAVIVTPKKAENAAGKVVKDAVTVTTSIGAGAGSVGAGSALTHLRDRPDFEHARPLPAVRRGNLVYIEAQIRDQWALPSTPKDGTVKLTLKTTGGTTVLSGGTMTAVDLGIVRYVYATQATDPLGIYVAEIDFEG